MVSRLLKPFLYNTRDYVVSILHHLIERETIGIQVNIEEWSTLPGLCIFIIFEVTSLVIWMHGVRICCKVPSCNRFNYLLAIDQLKATNANV